jgi:hypothetical protein
VRIYLLLSLALLASIAHAQQTTLPLWPNGTPEPYTGAPETDITKPTDRLVDGKPLAHLTKLPVTHWPTLVEAWLYTIHILPAKMN